MELIEYSNESCSKPFKVYGKYSSQSNNARIKATNRITLVSRQLCNVGKSRDIFILASLVVKCQFTFAFLLFLNFFHAATSFLTISILSILPFKHWPVRTLNSISAIFNQLPCLGVYANSNLSHNALPYLAKTLHKAIPGYVCLGCPLPRLFFLLIHSDPLSLLQNRLLANFRG